MSELGRDDRHFYFQLDSSPIEGIQRRDGSDRLNRQQKFECQGVRANEQFPIHEFEGVDIHWLTRDRYYLVVVQVSLNY